MLAGMQKARDRFKWDYYGSPKDVVQRRRDVLTAFIADFQSVTRSGRYVSASLPELPFLSESFDLVLCSHLLFSTLPNSTQQPTSPSYGNCFA